LKNSATRADTSKREERLDLLVPQQREDFFPTRDARQDLTNASGASSVIDGIRDRTHLQKQKLNQRLGR
jgi:hypothetical protein